MSCWLQINFVMSNDRLLYISFWWLFWLFSNGKLFQKDHKICQKISMGFLIGRSMQLLLHSFSVGNPWNMVLNFYTLLVGRNSFQSNVLSYTQYYQSDFDWRMWSELKKSWTLMTSPMSSKDMSCCIWWQQGFWVTQRCWNQLFRSQKCDTLPNSSWLKVKPIFAFWLSKLSFLIDWMNYYLKI